MKIIHALLPFVFLGAATLNAMPAQVLIIRHAEKPADGNDLSPEGVQRAANLVKYFKTNSKVRKYGDPIAIYAMGPGDEDKSNRPVETVTPLATALGAKIHSKFTRDQYKEMVDKVSSDDKYQGKMVLICWEHTVIPDIAVAFGVTNAPDHWKGKVFDQVWEIDFDGNQVSGFQTFTQDFGAAGGN